ncbi:hypothetical protein BGX38DRAFT_1206964 [Terfezia claveryi]|nr:hypothetical protein BGX38DRAFT_1206964 [Terfezia claveryi]
MKFLTFTLSLVLGLVSLASANAVPSEDGITLPSPNGAGTCDIPRGCATRGKMCAGFAGIQCCKGLVCIDIEPVADGSGTCDIPHCSKKGKTCGGIAGIQCCPGLKCVGIPPDVADGTGTCRYEHGC